MIIISRSWHLLCLALCSVLPPLVARRPGEAEKEVSGAFSFPLAGELGLVRFPNPLYGVKSVGESDKAGPSWGARAPFSFRARGPFSFAFAGGPELLFHSEPEAPLLLNGTLMTNLRANLPENFFLTRESCPYPPLLTPLER